MSTNKPRNDLAGAYGAVRTAVDKAADLTMLLDIFSTRVPLSVDSDQEAAVRRLASEAMRELQQAVSAFDAAMTAQRTVQHAGPVARAKVAR